MKKRLSCYLNVICFMLLCSVGSLQVFAQQTLTISGKVADTLGEPIIGASILLKGTSNGTVTDIDGNFSLSGIPSNGTLVVSYIGYLTQEQAVNGKSVFTFKLKEDTQTLDEVVVVGYGVMRKSDLTGSVASVKASDALKTTPTSNVSDALQGRLAGVSVVNEGDPGKASTIRVRGINSISADSGPLVVIDGFIGGSLKNINPNDIQSIEVLKDASATAVYGSRGANGVILVTTKSPGKDQVSVAFNAFFNIKTTLKKPDLLSPAEYAELANAYGKEYFESQNKPVKTYYTEDQIKAFRNGSEGYDYIKNMFNNPAFSQNYDLSVSSGGEKTSFMASVRYEKNEGVIRKSEYEQFNWRLKVDSQLKKWMKVGVNISGDYTETSGPRMNSYEGLLISAINFPNTVKPQNADGIYNNTFAVGGLKAYNPMGHINEIDTRRQSVNNRVQGYVDFKIAEGLTFRSQLGVHFHNVLFNSSDTEKSYYFFKNGKTQAKAQSEWNFGWLNTNTLNYTKEFSLKHRINATAVLEQQYRNEYMHYGIGQNLTFPDYLGYNAIGWGDVALIESDRNISTLLSGMFRFNYVFMNRYMLTASLRADGSSHLEKKWNYFPSVALAWDMKQEAFMQKYSNIDQLKLRLGYGSVGNQAIPPYRINSKMKGVRNQNGTVSYVVDRPKAPNLKWERNEQYNVGVDLTAYNGRLTATLDWYSKHSKDVLMEIDQPAHIGYSSLLKNACEIKNTGVEATIGYTPIAKKDWNWNMNLTLAHNKGTFEHIPTLIKMQSQPGLYEHTLFKMIEGEKLGTFWGYTYEGVWKTSDVNAPYVDANGKTTGKTNGETYNVRPGQPRYKDLNNDGVINTKDQGIIGNGQPTFNWGFNSTLRYKDWDLTLFVVGFHGFDIYNATDQTGYAEFKGVAVDVVTPKRALLRRWTAQNENTDIPGFVFVKTPVHGGNSRFVEKGDFVKVKSITLGYNLPKKVCNVLRINDLRFYASVQNPFHITGYSGLDPEAALGTPLTQGADWGAYPNGRNYLFGLNFSF